MAPEKIDAGAVRIVRLIGMLMVAPMNGDPAYRTALQAAYAENDQRVREPCRTAEALVRQQPMIADVDAEHAEHVDAESRRQDAEPAERPGQQSEQRREVIKDDAVRDVPGARRRGAGIGWELRNA